MPNIDNIVKELKSRKVFRSLAIYAGFAFVLLQVCSIIIPGLFLPEWTMTFIIVLVIIGFPTTLVLSWIYDITPAEDGEKTPLAIEDDVPSETINKPGKSSLAKKILFPLTGFILTLIGSAFWFIYPFLSLATADNEDIYDTSIAVLYFDNIGDAENVFFADGLTEEIISRVSRIQNLRVIPRTDVKKYRLSNLGSSEISNELKVNYLLEGTVRKSNNKIRVTTNLIKSRDNSIIWNDTFDEDDSLIFVIQDQIAENIAINLDIKISGIDMGACLSRPTHSYKAFENMSKVKSNMMSLDILGHDDYNNLNNYFILLEETIQIDPDYSEAYAYLAMFTLWGALQNSFNDDSAEESDSLYYLAKSYSDTALELDERNEIALSVNIMMPIIAELITCDNFEDFTPSVIEIRELIKKTKTMLSYYPDSPLTNLLHGGAYFFKSFVPIIGEEDDEQFAEEYFLKSFNRSKKILDSSPNDGISYYIFYLTTLILSRNYIANNELLDAAEIAQEYVDFAENHNLLSSAYP